MGGMLSAIEQRYPQGEIENSAYQAQRAIEGGEATVVGVNKFCEEASSIPPILSIDRDTESRELARLAKFKAARDATLVAKSLASLAAVATGNNDGLMEAILECVRAHCSIGEISDTLRGVFGEYKGDYN
jgi:methylmalonyl-CoA mutase N-terminal domain/subunit